MRSQKPFLILLYGGFAAFSTFAVLQQLSSLNSFNQPQQNNQTPSARRQDDQIDNHYFSQTQPNEIDYKRLYSSTKFINTLQLNPIESVGLLLIVKSAHSNFERRETVRKTWGQPSSYLQNLKFGQTIQLYFLVGLNQDEHLNNNNNYASQFFYEESVKYKDIIIADFVDSYRNNTLKTILALRWSLEVFPNNFAYLSLVDDDVFVNVTNMVNFLNKIPEMKVVRKDFGYVNTDFLAEYSSEVEGLSVNSSSVWNMSDIPLYTGCLVFGGEVFRAPGQQLLDTVKCLFFEQ
jgi:hypothetical protein